MCLLVTELSLKSFTSERLLECLSPNCLLLLVTKCLLKYSQTRYSKNEHWDLHIRLELPCYRVVITLHLVPSSSRAVWTEVMLLLVGIHIMCLLVTKVSLKSFTSERPLECLSPICLLACN